MSHPSSDAFDELRRALKETVLNLERLVEQSERVLKRARERLDKIEADNPSPEDT
jgi:hypothetical protein